MNHEDRILALEAQVAYLMKNTRKISYASPFGPSDTWNYIGRNTCEPLTKGLECTTLSETNKET